jgi:hypothetical protein
MAIMKATAMLWPTRLHLKEPNDYKTYWKSWFEQSPMLPDKFETKVVENSGIQKSKSKVYLTKPN